MCEQNQAAGVAPATYRLPLAEDHLRMLLDHLLANAVNDSYDRGVVEVSCRAQSEQQVLFSTRDQGIDIPADKLPRVFDDFFRTREAVGHNRLSTGLGVAIVRQVARAWKMDLRLESAPGWGTRCAVLIPSLAAGTDLTLSPKRQSDGIPVGDR